MDIARRICLKLFLLLALFFPAFYSVFDADYLIEYYGGFSWAYAFLVLSMILLLLQKKFRKPNWYFWVILAGIAGYNLLFTYYNVRYLHWYGEQINNTIAFLFFLCLIGFDNTIMDKDQDIIPFLIKAAVISNLCSILYFIFGYTSLVICNNHIIFGKLPEDFYEFRHYWVYSHKSDYALMLIGFLALCIRYKDRFSKKTWYFFSLGVFLTSLVLTHSWTGVLGAFVVFVGSLLDRINWRQVVIKKIHIVGGLFAILLVAAGGRILLAERNLLTLGNRLPIWKGALRTIGEYPHGWGYYFGEVLIDCGGGLAVNNAHNIFLNAMLRFSAPVGICFTLLFVLILAYAIYKCRSWMGAGLCAASFMLLNMDYALMNYEVAMFLLIIFLVCLYEGQGNQAKK